MVSANTSLNVSHIVLLFKYFDNLQVIWVPFEGGDKTVLYVGLAPNRHFGCVHVQAFSSQTRKMLKHSYHRSHCTFSKQLLHNNTDPLFVGGSITRTTNPRWPTAAILKHVISRYLRNRLTDFDKVLFWILEIQDGGRRFKNYWMLFYYFTYYSANII